MNRFFIENLNYSKKPVQLPEGIIHQLWNVLRLKPGDQIELLDNRGNAYLSVLETDYSGGLQAKILSSRIVDTESRARLTLNFGLTKREKMEWILQKGTEIGVVVFQPFLSERTLVREAQAMRRKFDRWESILREAAEQSGRGRIPELRQPLRIADAVARSVEQDDRSLAAWVEEELPLIRVLRNGKEDFPQSVGLFTGPEGGFSAGEISLMKTSGVRTFSMGRRVLRMETAAILAPALVLYALGEMGAGLE